jgi:hypothetical protein
LDFFDSLMYAGRHSGHLTCAARTGSMNAASRQSQRHLS